METYKKLCEVGSCLYLAKKYKLCIFVLTTAHRLQTNQKGIVMKVQLTLANAYSATKQNEMAIKLYQVRYSVIYDLYAVIISRQTVSGWLQYLVSD